MIFMIDCASRAERVESLNQAVLLFGRQGGRFIQGFQRCTAQQAAGAARSGKTLGGETRAGTWTVATG
jgi:hypothetical protein